MFQLKGKLEQNFLQSQRDYLIRNINEVQFENAETNICKGGDAPKISFNPDVDLGLFQLQQDTSPLATKP